MTAQMFTQRVVFEVGSVKTLIVDYSAGSEWAEEGRPKAE